MAKDNDVGAGEEGQQHQDQPQQAAIAVISPKQRQAEHEAGHAVVTDDCDWTVLWVNIKDGAGKQRMMKADWGDFGKAVPNTDWTNAEQRQAMTPRVLDYVTTLVAGHLAENRLDPTVQRVSARIEENMWILEEPPVKPQADRDQVAIYLKRIHRNTLAEVVAAEVRATEILERREAHLKALAALLVQHEYVADEMLDQALGKAVTGEGKPD